MLVVVIETHVLNFGSEVRLAAADGRQVPPKPDVPAEAISEPLEEVARTGGRVLVLLDGVHTDAAGHWDTDISEWARDLRRRGVIVAVASKQGPSLALKGRGHRAFAMAVLESILPGGRFASADRVRTLAQFREIVPERVLTTTRRRQYAEIYIPETIDGRSPLLDPRRPRN